MNNASQGSGGLPAAERALLESEIKTQGKGILLEQSAKEPNTQNAHLIQSQQALELLFQDPVGFVQQIVNGAAEQHLSRLRDEAELRGVLNLFRKRNPEFVRFEPFILQEAAMLIQTDPDGVIDPWDRLLEKALTNFKRKFEETLKEASGTLDNASKTSHPPYMEGKSNRMAPEHPPSFTREQIAKMSLAEFLKNEAAINDAMRGNRIR